MWGVYAVLNTPVDAIPDLSENQVIVFTDWMGRSPQEIEDQVTYPLSLKLQGLAGVKAVRSSSRVQLLDDHHHLRGQRRLLLRPPARAGEADAVRGSTFLPPGVVPYLAPDATALGQIFWYTVEPGPRSRRTRPGCGRSTATTSRPQLNSVPGVAEVAIVGGVPLEYQIDVEPEALRAYGVTLGELYAAVARSNFAVGGRVIQKNNAEYLVRGVGWIEGQARDIENTRRPQRRHVASGGTPIYVKNVATVQLGQQFRRSVFEKDGNEVVGGVVLMRHGENPLAVTERRQGEDPGACKPGCRRGVRIVPAYDRTRLINGAIDTLTAGHVARDDHRRAWRSS